VNLTSSSAGLGSWSVEDIVSYLKVGYTQRGGTFGPMNNVIVNSTRHMSADDLHAIAVYLKSLSPQNPIIDRKATTEQIKAGAPYTPSTVRNVISPPAVAASSTARA